MFKTDLIQQGQQISPSYKNKKITPQKSTTPTGTNIKEQAKIRQSNDQIKNQLTVAASQEFSSTKSQLKQNNGVYFSTNFKKQQLKTNTNQSSISKAFESNSIDQQRNVSTSQEKPTDRSQSTNLQKKNIPLLPLGKTLSKITDKKFEKENVNYCQPLSARSNRNPSSQMPRQQTPQTERKGTGYKFSNEMHKKQQVNGSSTTPLKNKSIDFQKNQGASSKSKEREQVLVQRKTNANQTTVNGSTNHHNNTFKTFKTSPKQQTSSGQQQQQIQLQQKQALQNQIQTSSQQQQTQQQVKPKGLNGLVTSVKKGQFLPFQAKTPISQKKQANITPPKQYPKSPKSPIIQVISNQDEDPNQYIQSLISPAFNNSIYYQTGLIHYHYQAVYKQPSPYTFQFKLIHKSEEQANYYKDLYEEHFIQNFYSIQYCKQFKQKLLNEISSKLVTLPESNKKRTIVFDLDETLIHCKDEEDLNADVILNIDVTPEEQTKVITQFQISNQAYIYTRPYLSQMLQYLDKHFELLVFTASHQCYAEKVLDYIDPKRSLFAYRFYREHCVQLEEGLFTKDLRIIKNRKLEVLNYYLNLDNAAYSYCFQMENGIPIIPFYDNKNDKELIYLTHYLMDINNQQNWISKNAQTFKLDEYLKACSTEQCLYQIIEQTL